MPLARASTTIEATPAELWRTVADAHHLPRWWPRVERVERADRRGFTEARRSKRGNVVRVDYRWGDRADARRITWIQELEGTPFERLLRHAETRVLLEP